MPATRLNISVPAGLAARVRRLGLPISAICQDALCYEADLAERVGPGELNTVAVRVGGRGWPKYSHMETFEGRWLVTPDPDGAREGSDIKASWGVAVTAKDAIAVYCCAEDQAPSLNVYKSLDDIPDDALPESVWVTVRAAQSENYGIWRSI